MWSTIKKRTEPRQPALWKQIQDAKSCKKLQGKSGVKKPVKSTWKNRLLKQDKPRKRIRQKSKRRVRDERVYTAKAAAYLATHPNCEACPILRPEYPVNPSEHCHHTKRRGKFYLDETTYKAMCFTCHRWIHDNPAKSYELGLMIRVG